MGYKDGRMLKNKPAANNSFNPTPRWQPFLVQPPLIRRHQLALVLAQHLLDDALVL